MKQRPIEWPRRVPPLTDDEILINDDWNRYWFEINRDAYSRTMSFGHQYVARHSPADFRTSLDVGAGLGEQLEYEKLTPEQLAGYVCIERRPIMIDGLQRRWPSVQILNANCEERMPFDDGHFDRIIAIHVLEHLGNLPAFLHEAVRLLARPHGRMLMVIPCEGGMGYAAGRRVTSQRIFEKRYRLPYERFIRAEHVNTAREVLDEVRTLFSVEHQSWFPLKVPLVDLNLCIGMTLVPM